MIELFIVGSKKREVRRKDVVSGVSFFRFSLMPVNLLFVSYVLLLTSYFLLSPLVSRAADPNRICFGEHCLAVEIASDDAARMRGLQGRTSLDTGAGMLFVFSEEAMRNFWMKDTLIPLDMIWLDGSKQVVDLKANVPPCVKDPCPVYVPSREAQYVLETNAHYAQMHGVRVGDQAIFK